MVKTLFTSSIDKYSDDPILKRDLWTEIETRYSGRGRHYHTLVHIENLCKELLQYHDRFSNWDTVVFSIVYHDIIYNTLKKNNEEKSAAYCRKKLSKTSFPVSEIDHCVLMILATKNHLVSNDEEINLFTDADVSILGADQNTYFTYTKQIRKEYFLYPGFMYRSGRMKALNHFLAMERIFKTDSFFDRYEVQARRNLLSELTLLKQQ